MSALARHVVRASAWSGSVVLIVALAAGGIRLLPWALAPELPWRVVAPFAQALGAVSLETALFFGAPMGAALGAAELVQRGEARALFALGASPRTICRGLLVPLLLMAALSVVTTLAWQPSTDRPGAFARALIEQGSSGCNEKGTASVGVPIVGVTWLCFGGAGAQRLAGPVPRSGGRIWYTARQLEVSDDLRVFRARDVRVATRPRADRPHLKLQVREAEIRGLPGWGRGAPLEVGERASLLAIWVLVQSFVAAWAVLRFAFGRGLGLLLGALPAIVGLRALHGLPSGSGPSYAVVQVLGVGIAVLVGCVALPSVLVFLRRRLPGLRSFHANFPARPNQP